MRMMRMMMERNGLVGGNVGDFELFCYGFVEVV